MPKVYDAPYEVRIVDSGVPILIIICLGWICAQFRFMNAHALPMINKFVFIFAIPCIAFKSLSSMVIDAAMWDFFYVFLILRVIFIGFALFLTACGVVFDKFAPDAWKPVVERKEMDLIGRFLVHWTGTTWLNSVIFGIPILTAIYPTIGAALNIFASMSSFFFQLPMMLLLYEIRRVYRQAKGYDTMLSVGSASVVNPAGVQDDTLKPADRVMTILDYMPKPPVLLQIFLRVATNPPLIGIFCGLIAEKGLRGHREAPTEPMLWDDMPMLITTFIDHISGTVTPLAAFCIGLFTPYAIHECIKVDRVTIITLLMHIILKMFIMPAIAIDILKSYDLKGPIARSGVIIASLPVALSAFTLAHQYDVGRVEMSGGVVIGTFLMIPITIMWIHIMDNEDLFKLPTPP